MRYRCRVLLEQVWFVLGDLLRKTGICALKWRRSPPFFHICANDYAHLRRQPSTPAPPARYTCTATSHTIFSQIQAHIDMPLIAFMTISCAFVPF